MGVVIKSMDLSVFRVGIQRPIVYCSPDPCIIDQAVPINVEMAKKLIGIKPKKRAVRIDQCLRQMIEPLPDDTVIKDFDVLFNPNYEVDILRIMCLIGKNKPYRIIWPGTFDGKRLFYAEEGYRDYKVYEIEKYDLTCVI